jgi:hypothetical protein
MNKKLYIILLLFAGMFTSAGMQAQQPNLPHVKVGQGIVQGTRIPILDTIQRNSLVEQGGENKFLRGVLIYNSQTDTQEYWNGERWVSLGGDGASPWFVTRSTNPATSDSDTIYHTAPVVIGYNGAADPTAALNVVSDNKGVLLPRVALKSATDKVTIKDPTAGLLVYNTGTESTFTIIGYMFWDGTQWRLFANTSSESAKAVLNCAGAQMSPSQQITGGTAIVAGTVLQIPYTGSNGGSFNGATLVSTGNPDVTATIAGGMLGVGNGMLNFALSGTPTVAQQAPNGITFDLTPFLNANTSISGCNEVTVGNVLSASIEETAVMGNLMLMTDNLTSTEYYGVQCNSPNGKFSVRVGVPTTTTTVAYGNQTLNVQVRNNQSTEETVIWNFMTEYDGHICTPGVLKIPSQRWGGDMDSGNTWTSYNNNNVYWGQVGIYDAQNTGPEYRRYTWIPIGENNKVSYEITVMAALDTATPTVAVSPTKVKCYIKFTQVTAM